MTGDQGRSSNSRRRVVRTFSLLVAGGLAVELLTLSSLHPAAFLSFVFFGLLTVGVGTFGFLWLRRR